MKIKLASIQRMAAHRPAGYYEDVVGRGQIEGDILVLSAASYAALRAKYSPLRPPKDWPVWALVVALFAQPKDRGIGDTLRREVGGPKTERFKRWHEATFGLWSSPCGCGKLALWNEDYRYESSPPDSGAQWA